ncbi:MAG: hypothetical protein AAB923_01880 [Patescibacteria group bacterium]
MRISELNHTRVLHHAYLVAGGAERGKVETLALLEARGVQTKGNPDVLALSFSELLVDDVRDAILTFAALRPMGERKYVIISFSRANDSAQNALLKAVEESLGRTCFFFSVDAPGHVLPTLRSRCITVSLGEKAEEDPASREEAEGFLKAGYAERLAVVEKMTGYISKTQDRTPVRAFVGGLLTVARDEKLSARVLRDILDATRYLRMQGSSAKAVLGHLAVSLPRS